MILNGDLECAEWGYFSFSELKEVKVGLWVNSGLRNCLRWWGS